MLTVTGLCPSSSLKFRSAATWNRHKTFGWANKERTRTFIHQNMMITQTRLMVCFSRRLRSRFSLLLPGQWLRKAPAIPVSKHSHSGRCPRPFKDPVLCLNHFPKRETSLLQARRRCDMKNWCVYLCFHMRPISRTLCLRWQIVVFFFEKSYLKTIFSWNELLFCVFMCRRSTMGNNGLKLIQLFQRGRAQHKKIIWFLFMKRERLSRGPGTVLSCNCCFCSIAN